MERVVKVHVEIPVDDYINMVLLVANGEYLNLRQIVLKGIRKVFEEYGEGYFKKLREENKEIVENIQKKAKIVERKRVRKWIVK
mgnify:CR=1 FL=1